ncbi:MAG: glutamate synthase-related protein [Pseudomonadota bacterium]
MHRCDAYWKQGNENYIPDIIHSIQQQAAEGKIPVSGAGYGGPFDGSGYDNIWTDMSEIVRPTRDGIHGREHISTTINLGRFASDLCGMQFDAQGNLKTQISPTREIRIPVLFGLSPFSPGAEALASLALAASKLTTYATIRAEDHPERFKEYFNHLVVHIKPSEVEQRRTILEWASIVEFDPDGDQIAAIMRARKINPHLLTIVVVPAKPDANTEILRLVNEGAETIHLIADINGQGENGVSLLECLRATHNLLVEQGVRDQITLIASGGVAKAEHVPKTIILGADAVKVDIPLYIAMECAMCGECRQGKKCSRAIDSIDRRWGATRVINLMLSWRDQLLEVLGAMGLRDVRRLRGEKGRAIFADVAKEDFFNKLKLPAPSKTVGVELIDDEMSSVEDHAHRFPFRIGEFRVEVDRTLCTDCGICVTSCRLGVHRRRDGVCSLEEPIHGLCIGSRCENYDWCCVKVCPEKAIRIERDPVDLVLGDRRWTASILRETWRQSHTGDMPKTGDTEQIGDSGGGFDILRLRATPGARKAQANDEIDLSISLNRRKTGPRLRIPLPIYGGGMSYGSISLSVMLGRAMAARELGTFISTGEGGYPKELFEYSNNVITQIATGLFGVREETILCAPLVEFKYAQGAKPGLGGHLLGEKNTPKVAAMREAVTGTSLFSPFPFHSVYSVEDHKKHLDWVRTINPDVLVSVKVSTPADVDMVAIGSYYAGTNIVHLDGAYGGTGAAPDIAKKNIAQPIEYATVQTHDFLVEEGIRDEVVLMVSGGIRTPEDVLKAIALGADGVVLGTAELVAIGCVRCGNCERERGCPIGIATTDPELTQQLSAFWVRDRIVNLYRSWGTYMKMRISALGLKSVQELRGRWDLLTEVGKKS